MNVKQLLKQCQQDKCAVLATNFYNPLIPQHFDLTLFISS